MRKLSLLFFMVFCIIAAHAENVSLTQAREIAKDFFTNRGTLMTATNAKKAPLHSGSATRQDTEMPYYIFDADGNKGYVIVSGSTLTEQILGYSDEGSFNEADMPEALKEMLDSYAQQIAWMEANAENVEQINTKAKNRKKASGARHAIEPMLSCEWEQYTPYNNSLPAHYGNDGTLNEASATGCGATAIAQVLHYYKYPTATVTEIPALTNTYTTTNGEKTVTIPAIPAGTPIDWANMLDSYKGNYTEAEAEAVANLMLYVGQMMEMHFSTSSTCSTMSAATRLPKYMGFDSDARAVWASDYSIQEWFDLLYSELATGNPLIFRGANTNGGHAVLLDGFDGNCMFHVNWGWGGNCNGYYRLVVMDPANADEINATATSNGYAIQQGAVIGLRPGDDGIRTDTNDQQLSYGSIRVRNSVFTINVTNNSTTSNNHELCILTRDADGEFYEVSDVSNLEMKAGASASVSIDVAGKFTKPGTYRVTPASRLYGETEWNAQYSLYDKYYLATVDDDLNVSLKKYTPKTDIEVLDLSLSTTGIVKTTQKIKLTLRNNGNEYKETMSLYASQTATKGNAISECYVALKEGETAEFIFEGFKPTVVGTWNIWIDDLATTTVEIVKTLKGTANLHVNSINITSNGYGDRLVGEVVIQNNGTETYNGIVEMQAFQAKNYSILFSSEVCPVEVVNLEPGNTDTYTFEIAGLTTGNSYYVTANYTTQRGRLDNGDIFNDEHYYALSAGAIMWNSFGKFKEGIAVGETVACDEYTSAVRFFDCAPATVETSANPNTLYIFNGYAEASGLDFSNAVVDGVADEINISSDFAFYSPIAFTASKVTFSHTFTSTSWEHLALPFKVTSVTIDGEDVSLTPDDDKEALLRIREFCGQNISGEIGFKDVESFGDIYANTPYVMSITSEELIGKTIIFSGDDVSFTATDSKRLFLSTNNYAMCGTLCDAEVSDAYILNEMGDTYIFTEGVSTIKAHSTYFVTSLPQGERVETIVIASESEDSSATAIKNLAGNGQETEADKIYDLQGRRLFAVPQRGVYIKNGKKFVR